MPQLQRPGYVINYTLEGARGAPLLAFSNSLGSALGMWNLQAPEFTKSFRVLRYDNRGHGGSTAPPGPYSLEQVATDLAFLLAEIGDSSVNLCGLSLGGMVGMWLACHRPQLIRKLVLANTAAWMGPASNWEDRIAAVRAGGMQAVSSVVIERWFTAGFRAKSPGLVAPIERSFLEVSVEGYIGCCAAIRDMDQRDRIAEISTPTLVIAGTHDPSTPPAAAQFIASKINQARYVELPAAHLSNIEAAAAFNSAVSSFLAE